MLGNPTLLCGSGGLGSLLSIDIMRALEKRLGRRLSTDLLLSAPSMEDMVEYIDKDLRG
jgi:acyl carrier protein